MLEIRDEGAVRVLTLAREKSLNAFNGALFDALVEGLLEAQADVGLIDTIERQKDGTITGISSGRCEAGRCDAPFVFEIPADGLGSATIDAMEVEAAPAEEAPFDAWRVTPPADREDPCAAFDGG